MAKKTKQRSFFEKNFHFIVIGVVGLVVGAVYLNKSNGNTSYASGQVPAENEVTETASEGRMAPDFSLVSTEGKTVKLSDFRGKVVVLDFWATWCPPCKAEIPDFIKLYSKYKDSGFQMLGVSVDQGGLGDVIPFMKSYGINYPILMANSRVVSSYGGIRGIPTTFVIDKEGKIRASYEGYRPASVFEGLVKQLTSEN